MIELSTGTKIGGIERRNGRYFAEFRGFGPITSKWYKNTPVQPATKCSPISK